MVRCFDFRSVGRNFGTRHDAGAARSDGQHDYPGRCCMRTGKNTDQRRMRRKDHGSPDPSGRASLRPLAGRRLRLVPIDAVRNGVRMTGRTPATPNVIECGASALAITSTGSQASRTVVAWPPGPSAVPLAASIASQRVASFAAACARRLRAAANPSVPSQVHWQARVSLPE